MIHEWRRYRLKPGAAKDYLTLLAETGLPHVSAHLPLMGYWLAESGGLNAIHHLWSYADWTEREACRAGLAADPAWMQGFVGRAFALVESQTSQFFHLECAGPGFHAALALRRRRHGALAPGAALLADDCAPILWARPGAAAHSAFAGGDWLAQFRPLSGGDRALALGARGRDPLAGAGPMHQILRPLTFSPL